MVGDYILSVIVSLYNLFVAVLAQATSPEVEVAVLQRLRNLIDQQRDQIRARDRELNAKSAEVENVSKVFLSHTLSMKEIFENIRRKMKQAEV
jgi:hypothetical protein